MGRDLGKNEDIDTAVGSFKGGGNYVALEDGETPLVILSAKYSDGYAHWVNLPDGANIRVICAGGLEGGGFAPDVCELCKVAASRYKKAKDLARAGKEDAATEMKDNGNKIRSRYFANFVVAKGAFILAKIKGEKKKVPDFDDKEVGIYNMSQSQYKLLVGLRGSEEYDFITEGSDLVNRVLKFTKARKGTSKYTQVIHIQPGRKEIKLNIDEEEIDTLVAEAEANAEVDEEAVTKAVKALRKSRDDVEEEFQEYEEDDDEKPKKKSKKVVEEEEEDEKPKAKKRKVVEEEEDEKPKAKKKGSKKVEEDEEEFDFDDDEV
jgi:hypothetical protein